MHIITKKKDLLNLPLTFSEVKGFISARLNGLSAAFDVTDISSFGAFIILESATEINYYAAMMLTESITKDNIEWVQTIKADNTTYYNICIARDDVFAVNIFIDSLIIDNNIKNLIGGFINENS